MNKKSDQLINTLTLDLRTTKVLWSPLKRSIVYCLTIFISLVFIILYTSGFRVTFSDEIVHPRILIELLLSISAFFFLCLAAFKSIIPGERNYPYQQLGFFFAFSFCTSIIFNFAFPFEHQFIHAHNKGCLKQIYGFSVALQIGILFFLNKGMVFAPLKTALMSSLGVSIMTVSLLNFTCKMDYAHIFKAHFLAFAITSFALSTLTYLYFYFSKKRKYI